MAKRGYSFFALMTFFVAVALRLFMIISGHIGGTSTVLFYLSVAAGIILLARNQLAQKPLVVPLSTKTVFILICWHCFARQDFLRILSTRRYDCL